MCVRRRISKKLPNGAASEYAWDAKGQLVERIETGKGGGLANGAKTSYRYEYDADGNRTKEVISASGTGKNKTTYYRYDALGQLIQARDEKGTRSYAYDAFSNRTEKKESGKESITYRYNENSQLTESTQGGKTTRYTYDARGSLTGKEKEGKPVQSYVFDSAGRLAKVVGDAGGDQSVTTRYAYDGFGNRIRKTVKRDGKTTAEYHYTTDWTSAYGNSICIKETVTGNTRLFTYGEEILAVAGGGKTEYYRTNEQQTVTEMLDASGDVRAAYAYDEFGVLTEVRTPETKTAEAEKALEAGKGNGRDLEKAQSQQTEPAGRIEPEDEFFAYTGYLYDGSTGLYYAKDRYYDAEAGRFISKDRCENDSSAQESLNRYVYVGNNPIKYTDPSGETAAVVVAGAAGTVAIPLSAVLTLAIVVLGVTTLIEVTGSYLKTPEGQRLLKRASKVLYDGKEYAVGLFKKIAHWVGAETKARFAKIKKAAKKIWDWIRGAEKTGGTQASAGAIELLSKKVREEQKGKSNNAKGKGQANSVPNNLGELGENAKHHILQDKHNWHKLVPNPKDPNNWGKIALIMSQVLSNGNQQIYKDIKNDVIYINTLKIKNEIVEVTYRIVNGIIKIGDAWVK